MSSYQYFDIITSRLLLEVVLFEEFQSKKLKNIVDNFSGNWHIFLNTTIKWSAVTDEMIYSISRVPNDLNDYILFLRVGNEYKIRVPKEYWLRKKTINLAKNNVEFTKILKNVVKNNKKYTLLGIDIDDVPVTSGKTRERSMNKKLTIETISEFEDGLEDTFDGVMAYFKKYFSKNKSSLNLLSEFRQKVFSILKQVKIWSKSDSKFNENGYLILKNIINKKTKKEVDFIVFSKWVSNLLDLIMYNLRYDIKSNKEALTTFFNNISTFVKKNEININIKKSIY